MVYAYRNYDRNEGVSASLRKLAGTSNRPEGGWAPPAGRRLPGDEKLRVAPIISEKNAVFWRVKKLRDCYYPGMRHETPMFSFRLGASSSFA